MPFRHCDTDARVPAFGQSNYGELLKVTDPSGLGVKTRFDHRKANQYRTTQTTNDQACAYYTLPYGIYRLDIDYPALRWYPKQWNSLVDSTALAIRSNYRRWIR